MKTPDAYPASDADSFDCTDTIGHTDPVGPLDAGLVHSPGHATPPSAPAPSAPAPKQLARTDADMAGILADVGMLSLLGALAVAARRHGA